MNMKLDYILVGQGLAGSILSYQLLSRGKNILVINQSGQNISSTVAAGIYNPITGRSMVKSWMADQLFSYLIPFYRKLEEEIGVRLININTYIPPVYFYERTKRLDGQKLSSYVQKLYRGGHYLC